MVTRRIQKITEERLDSDDSDASSLSAFSDGDTSDTAAEEDENENNISDEDDANEEIEEPEVADQVRSKVDEMMRNLQGLNNNNPDSFEFLADNDDLDMFDVYEEDD
jgi:hypothetical protein